MGEQAEKKKLAEQEAKEVAERCLPKPMFWKLDLPEVKTVLSNKGILPGDFVKIEHPHATLMYLGGEEDSEKIARKSGLTVLQVDGMKEALECMKDDIFEAQLTQIVVDENMACGVLTLPSILPCSAR